MIAALYQKQAASAQGVAHRKGEGDFPNPAVELAACDQMGAPVRLHEAVRIIDGQSSACAGIQGPQYFDCREQSLGAGGSLEWQRKKSGQILAQCTVAGEHGVEMAARFQPLVGPARNCGLDQRRRVLCGAKLSDGLRAVGRDQRIDGTEHTM